VKGEAAALSVRAQHCQSLYFTATPRVRIAVLTALPYFSFHCSCLLGMFYVFTFINFVFFKTNDSTLKLNT
jgi:hypothetical protein